MIVRVAQRAAIRFMPGRSVPKPLLRQHDVELAGKRAGFGRTGIL